MHSIYLSCRSTSIFRAIRKSPSNFASPTTIFLYRLWSVRYKPLQLLQLPFKVAKCYKALVYNIFTYFYLHQRKMNLLPFPTITNTYQVCAYENVTFVQKMRKTILLLAVHFPYLTICGCIVKKTVTLLK